MRFIGPAILLALGIGIGTGYVYAHRDAISVFGSTSASAAAPHSHTSERAILYFRDPTGAPVWSTTPKQDAQGRDFVPVYDDEEPSFEPAKPAQAAQGTRAAQGERKILYYRNPMGLPDTSPLPKKDSMGMSYIPVYEGDETADDGPMKISLGRVQRAGVRTEPVGARVLVHPVRAVGTTAFDERKLTVVTLRADGFVEDLFVNTTGQNVRAGQPLFRLYSSQIQQAQIDLIVAVGAAKRAVLGADGLTSLNGAMQRLRNLAVPEERIREVKEKGDNPRTIDWPSPASGTIISKKVINGQRVQAGDELYRIADLSTIWVIADIAESDLAVVKVGTPVTVTFRAYPDEPVAGKVSLIYPELKTETRTARVRIELPNPDLRLKTDMYADVVFRTGADNVPVAAVPESAVIHDDDRRLVFVAKGDGRFEPRPVKLGRSGEGYREVLGGVREGEEIVTTATFLIDAESNLRTALKTFTPAEASK